MRLFKYVLFGALLNSCASEKVVTINGVDEYIVKIPSHHEHKIGGVVNECNYIKSVDYVVRDTFQLNYIVFK